MRRFLVVANQTLGGRHLIERIRQGMAAGPARFYVVVPATPVQDHLTWTEGEAQAIAQERLDAALARFREVGAEADGEVGDPRPLEAIRDALLKESFDEIILSTLPPGLSRWLNLDLPHRVEKSFELPVTHVVSEVEGTPGDR
jgi:cell pole-organizing protein PopZ